VRKELLVDVIAFILEEPEFIEKVFIEGGDVFTGDFELLE